MVVAFAELVDCHVGLELVRVRVDALRLQRVHCVSGEQGKKAGKKRRQPLKPAAPLELHVAPIFTRVSKYLPASASSSSTAVALVLVLPCCMLLAERR